MERLVVIGNGMAGTACVDQILEYSARFDITILGDETHVNYNRILLSSVLAGEKSPDEIVLNSLDWYRKHSIQFAPRHTYYGRGFGGKNDHRRRRQCPRRQTENYGSGCFLRGGFQ